MRANKTNRLFGKLTILFMPLLYGCGVEIENGEQAFQRCVSCHSMRHGINYTGPSLAGVFGRQAGTIIDFNYSDAVRSSGVVWSAENLDAWLTNPQLFIPGTKMEFEGIPDRSVREELIVILKSKTTISLAGDSLP